MSAGFLFAFARKQIVPRLVDQREGKREPPGIELRDEIGDDLAGLFLQRGGPGKQRSGMPVVPHSEQNQIVAVNFLPRVGPRDRSSPS